MVEWKLRKFNDSDINQFLEWRKLVARREKNNDYLMWEYFKSPWGPVETTIADYNGEIIGQYSTQRYEVFYFGEKMMASLSYDTGTHPDFRRQGVFVTLGTHHFREEGKQNIHFSTGFPNENFWPGGRKFNWHALCSIPLMINKNATEINVEKNSQFEIKEINHFDKEFENFSEKFKDDISIYLNRTRKYLNWRFVVKPNLKDPRYQYEYYKYKLYDKTGEMLAYFVIKYYNSGYQTILHLVDFLLPNNEAVYIFLLDFLVSKIKKQEIDTISMFLMKHDPFANFLGKYGFKYKITNRVYIVRTNNDYLDQKVIYDEKNHFITMADSDVF